MKVKKLLTLNHFIAINSSLNSILNSINNFWSFFQIWNEVLPKNGNLNKNTSFRYIMNNKFRCIQLIMKWFNTQINEIWGSLQNWFQIDSKSTKITNHPNLPTRFANICLLNTRTYTSQLNRKILAHFCF